jgi:hypothetical protein
VSPYHRVSAARPLNTALGGTGECMNSREYFGVGASLLGIYTLIQGIATLPGVAAAYEVSSAGGASSPAIYTLAVASESVLLVVVGSVLIYRYRGGISSASLSHFSTQAALSVGLSLLGVYFVISGMAGVLANVGQALLVHSSWQFRFSPIASGVLYAFAGVALTLRASFVAARLVPAAPSN